MRKSDYETFIDKFQPKFNEESIIWDKTDWNYINSHKIENIWTVIEDSGKWYICSGCHVVNRIGYCLTNKPWKEGQKDYLYD